MSRQDTSRVTDLVCRMNIRPEDAATTEEYEGRMFYFCSVAARRSGRAHATMTSGLARRMV